MQARLLGIFLTALTMSAVAANTNLPALVPLPKTVECRSGVFKLTSKTQILVDKSSEPTGNYLAEKLRASTGFPLKVKTQSNPKAKKGAIVIAESPAVVKCAEAYDLTVDAGSVLIRGADSAGSFYGVQTLLQLLPPQAFASKKVADVEWTAPNIHIADQPRFAWRGMMLDVSRHFFNKEEVKKMLDEMASQKMNVFHWHLVDDPGWRIEIKKYPKLTEIGAWRKDIGFKQDPKGSTAYGPDGRYGGFYTQNDIREVVAYAAARHITIVPEIEMPGHSVAALAANPQLSCSGGPYTTDIGAGIHAGVYCAGNDDSYTFIQDVLSEVIDLFPSKYIHIGGDEVPKDNWKACPKCQARMKAEGLKDEKELQSYFVRRIEKFINSKNRNLIGWSEIREGGLAQNAAVMDWIGGAVEAATAGHDVVMSPTTDCYLDYYQSQNKQTEPLGIGGFLPLKRVYSFEPIPAKLDAQYQQHILGGQGNLWTEYVSSFKHVEYMAFPRLSALAEVVWSPKEARDWDDFTCRMQGQYKRFDVMEVHYRADK